MRTIIMQGHDRKGFDTERCYNMEDVKAYLRHPHHGDIIAHIDGKEIIVPKGLGARFELDALDRMYF